MEHSNFSITIIIKLIAAVAFLVTVNSKAADDLRKFLPSNITFKSNVGITPFPYDLSQSSVNEVSEFVGRSGNVYTVQLDNGIPWQAALDDKPFSRKMMDEWQQHLNNISPAQQIYLAIAPLQDDRISWATAFEGKDAPKWVRSETGLNNKITKAYISYVNRAIDYFNPAYVNIGVEAGDLAAKQPEKWTSVENLFQLTIKSIKAVNVDIKVGISWGLPLLMKDDVFKRSTAIMDRLDYVGISFYPYLDQFYEKIGGVGLPEPPDQWRIPFNWLQANISKPIAICETAYSSHDVELSDYQLSMHSNSRLQAQYVEELAKTASRDNYLFTVFFLLVDYDELMDKLGIAEMALWRHTGFFSAGLVPKPAWKAYLEHWLNVESGKGIEATLLLLSESDRPSNSSYQNNHSKDEAIIYSIKFDSARHLFESEDTVRLSNSNTMQWTYTGKKNEWAWALKSIKEGSLKDSTKMSLNIRSNQPGDIYVQLQESSGESFYKIINIDKKWQTLELQLDRLELDLQTADNKIINAEKIERIMFADEAAERTCCAAKRLLEVSEILFKK